MLDILHYIDFYQCDDDNTIMSIGKQKMLEFLQSKKLVAIATTDSKNKPWVCNVYYSVDKDFNLFFVSATTTKHSTHISKKSDVAFTVSWFDEQNHEDRVAVQSTGKCELLKDPIQIVKFLTNHYQYFPSWKNSVTYDNMLKKLIESRPYVIRPTYMKLWNDKLLGEEHTEEFTFK